MPLGVRGPNEDGNLPMRLLADQPDLMRIE
jgi:hypothetical protein